MPKRGTVYYFTNNSETPKTEVNVYHHWIDDKKDNTSHPITNTQQSSSTKAHVNTPFYSDNYWDWNHNRYYDIYHDRYYDKYYDRYYDKYYDRYNDRYYDYWNYNRYHDNFYLKHDSTKQNVVLPPPPQPLQQQPQQPQHQPQQPPQPLTNTSVNL